MIAIRSRQRNFDGSKQISLLCSQYSNALLLLTHVVLPGVSSVLFRYFQCIDVDPDGVLSGSQLYLQSDLTISCTSNRYHMGLVWVSLMIILYPIGIPLLYFTLLYKVK